MNLKKVLLATDFSRPSMQLLDCLDEFKTLGLEEVVLVHVIDARAKGVAKAYQGLEREILEAQQKRLESIGLRVKSLIPVAIPNLELVKIAREEQVSLILISSHGQGIIKNIYLGSTTNDVIRVSTVPVMIEKYQNIDSDACSIMCLNKFKKVLLTLDFSIHSQRLLDEFKGLAHLVEEVVLLTVIEGSYNDEELRLNIEARQAQIQEIQLDLEKLGLRVKTIVQQGSAADVIVRTAEDEEITLVMMAKRGAGLIRELLLGSTAHDVIKRSSRPVLLIPTAAQ
ncbi:MAG: universal stress protein [Syntrophomonadaceae bacterium]|nr:universal stress protein [Syntrophomonadaceae bacterium]